MTPNHCPICGRPIVTATTDKGAHLVVDAAPLCLQRDDLGAFRGVSATGEIITGYEVNEAGCAAQARGLSEVFWVWAEHALTCRRRKLWRTGGY